MFKRKKDKFGEALKILDDEIEFHETMNRQYVDLGKCIQDEDLKKYHYDQAFIHLKKATELRELRYKFNNL